MSKTFPTSKMLLPNTTYTVSASVTVVSGTVSGSFGRVSLYNPKTAAFLNLIAGGTAGNVNRTLTMPSDIADYTTFYLYGIAEGVLTITNIQIEAGSAVTSYEPYKGNSYTIPLPAGTSGVVAIDEIQEIQALSGTNTVYTNGGNVTVEGRQGWEARMKKVEDTILALGG